APCRLRKVWLGRPYSPVRRSLTKFPETTRFCAIVGAVYEISGLEPDFSNPSNNLISNDRFCETSRFYLTLTNGVWW
ncbi:MAG: hypothetical protein ACR2PT_17925, partial [Endozoicomonas sp.]